MPSGDPDRDPPPLGPLRGFSTYADDTPRELADDPPPADPFDDFDPFEPSQDDLRFAAPEALDEAPPPPPRRFGALAVAGALVAVLGVGAGLMLVRGGRPP